MSEKQTGGPAFPVAHVYVEDQHLNSQGMTLRDYFAAKAMHQLMAGAILPVGYDASEELVTLGNRSYEIADAMLKARDA